MKVRLRFGEGSLEGSVNGSVMVRLWFGEGSFTVSVKVCLRFGEGSLTVW